MSKVRGKFFISSININDFFLISNNLKVLTCLKDSIIKKYNMKNLKKVKIIIMQQIIRDLDIRILEINELAFIYNFFKSKNMIDCNFVNTSIKIGCFIDI